MFIIYAIVANQSHCPLLTQWDLILKAHLHSGKKCCDISE